MLVEERERRESSTFESFERPNEKFKNKRPFASKKEDLTRNTLSITNTNIYFKCVVEGGSMKGKGEDFSTKKAKLKFSRHVY